MAAKAVVEATPKRGCSRKGNTCNKNRLRTTVHVLLYNDYFVFKSENGDFEFCWRYSGRDYDDYFELNIDCIGVFGFSYI